VARGFFGWWEESSLVKEWRFPFGSAPESLYVMSSSKSNSSTQTSLADWVALVLGRLNWRSHLFVAEDGPSDSRYLTQKLLDCAAAHLESLGFTNLHIHSHIRLGASAGSQREQWDRLVEATKRFQHEAHELLSEARLHFAPILDPAPEVSYDNVLRASEYFRSRLAIPSFCLTQHSYSGLHDLLGTDDARFFIDTEGVGLPTLLWKSHVFETILERVDEESETTIGPCRGHLVVDAEQGRVFSCFHCWKNNRSGVDLDVQANRQGELPAPPTGGDCLACIADAALSMRANLLANNREVEGRRVFFKLSLELAGAGQLDLAADLALAAFEFSRSDDDRVAALIQQALCLRDLGQLEMADKALEKAVGFTDDKGQIAYHRGRVQFVWRDYIEALEWFEEALDSGSNQVPVEDMCFEMALCHINIEEYPEARPYLERSQKPGDRKAPVLFYKGICDYSEGHFETALNWFREALSAGPATEDLGRILFYVGACLKEMERFEGAVEVLREAVATEPTELANHNLLGFCYYKLKRHEEAVACFLQAVEIDPRSGIDWANLGSNLRDLGKTNEAILMYKKALSLDPSIGFARENLDKLVGQRGN